MKRAQLNCITLYIFHFYPRLQRSMSFDAAHYFMTLKMMLDYLFFHFIRI